MSSRYRGNRDRYRSRSRSRSRDRGRRDSGGRDGRVSNRRPPNIEGMVSLKVDNLSYRITPEELLPKFEEFGEVGDVYIPRDRYSKESRGFAFVRFFERRDAEDAMEKMDGYVLDGREMRVQTARYGRPQESPKVRYGRNFIPPRGGGGSRRSRSRSYSPRRQNRRSSSRDSRNRRSYSRSHSRDRSRSRDGKRSLSPNDDRYSRSP